MYLINDVIERLKEELKAKTDKEIYDILGVSQGVFSNWKARNKIPYLELTTLCFEENINLKYILTGEKEEINQKIEIYKDKLREIIKEIDDKESKYFYYLIKSKLAEKELK